MEKLLTILENFSLMLILGGGIIMSACVRPLLLKAIIPTVKKSAVKESVVSVIDEIRVHAWTRYNLTALVCGLIVVGVQGLQSINTGNVLYVPLCSSLLIVLALTRKLIIDKHLNKRLVAGLPAHGSSIEDSEQKELAFWTICALIGALILTVYTALS